MALAYLGFIAQDLGLAERKRRQKVVLFTTLGVVLLSVAILGGYLLVSYKNYARLVETRLAVGRLQSRAGFYTTPRTIYTGQELTPNDLLPMLRRAGYDECAAEITGCFTLNKQSVTYHPYLDDENSTPDKVEITFAKDRIESISADGVIYDRYHLDPELLAHDTAAASAAPLTYQELPPLLVKGILALEDKDFLENRGANWPGAVRAVWRNLWPGATTASADTATIPQKLARDTFLTPERNPRGIFGESLLALAVETRHSREDILALYCNEVYLGQRGVTAIYGVAQGAWVFFGKDVKDLTLAETATLLGALQTPLNNAPDRYPAAALAQRNAIIARLAQAGLVTNAEAATANRESLTLAPFSPAGDVFAPYFIEYANRLVSDKLAVTTASEGNPLRVYTTLEPEVQRVAEKILRQQLAQLDQTNQGPPPQGALVALDVKTGQIVALIGGRDYRASPLNRATDAARAPGPTFLPFVYAAALEQGVSQLETFNDTPRAFTYENASYTPANENNAYANRPVPMRDGLVSSLNIVTTDVSLRIGLDKVVNLANRVGLPQKHLEPALALGVNETTPLALASAYTVFANGGKRISPNVVTQVLDAQGNALLPNGGAPEAAVSPATAYMITHTLKAVMQEGAGRAARAEIEEKTALAGKSGTARNGWFIGYTPSLICAVWLGHDDNSPLAADGAEAALKVWTQFIKEATGIRTFGGEEFSKPEDVRLFDVDLDNTKLANGYCVRHAETALLLDHVPTEECAQHTRETLTSQHETPRLPSLMPMITNKGTLSIPAKVPKLTSSTPVQTTLAAPAVNAPVAPAGGSAAPPLTNATPRQANAPTTPPLILAPPVLNTRPKGRNAAVSSRQ